MDRNVISAVIVTYNPDISVLDELVTELISQVQNIVIVDNNSNNIIDIEELSEKIDFILIKENENVGLASAQNTGIRRVLNVSTHIVIFDQDSKITKEFIKKQLKCEALLLDKGLKVSAVGPKFYDQHSGYEYPATIYTGPFIKRIDVTDEPVEATFVIASGSLIRTIVLNDVGLMLDDFLLILSMWSGVYEPEIKATSVSSILLKRCSTRLEILE